MRHPVLAAAFAYRGALTNLAEKLGLSTAAVASWENVPRRRRAAVAEILDVPEAALRPVEVAARASDP